LRPQLQQHRGCHHSAQRVIAQCYTVAGMAFNRESVKQHGDAIHGRVRVVARVLRCQSIKCPYTGVGAWTMCVQVPSSEAVLAEGVLSPRARRTSPEGVLGPRVRRTSPEGAFVVPSWWAAEAARVVIVSYVLGSWVSPCFAFFAGFKCVSPGHFRGPLWLSPTVAPPSICGCTR
jgi:hypothetical protein